MTTMKQFVKQIAKRLNFDLGQKPGALGAPVGLVVEAAKGDDRYRYTPLVIALWEDPDQRYSVGRVSGNGKPGFTVWYNTAWQPFKARNDFGSEVSDLALANQEMCDLVKNVYLD